jgi:hypothetical protein
MPSLSKETASFIETACWISIWSALLRDAMPAAPVECADWADCAECADCADCAECIECAEDVADALPHEPVDSEGGDARSRMSARGAGGAAADPAAATVRGASPGGGWPAPVSVSAPAGLLAGVGDWGDTSRASRAPLVERVGSIVIAGSP